jgi:hypothetical protein
LFPAILMYASAVHVALPFALMTPPLM